MSNRRIYKYALDGAEPFQTLRLSRDAQLLSVQMQHGQITLWAAVDPDAPAEPLDIAVFGTGFDMAQSYSWHLGTVQDGTYVWHVFARPR